ncbi:cytochrome P450 [Pseudenhygromyxa sp. WMMC2535]|uniref:cytochrome P450 n=1 Tax=Pseudenhygromyxa sp. WMMC2535 TaxID=2712867 RepID=UPI0015546D7C|nr:cytochrome P450 [Pseudenhygromyxa sp. WMMC2535]NVB39805.1 cytochrome P450 [Pseudenhygromyxa sp. WMMC2535]
MGTLPPGSRATLRNTYHSALHPFEFMAKMRARYGDPYSLSTLNGQVVVTAEPEHIRELFTYRQVENFDVFASSSVAAIIGRHSLLLLTGEAHRRERKLLNPPFHGERMRAYGEAIIAATRHAMSALRPGEGFRAIERTQAISLEVIIRAVFGVDDRALIDAHMRATAATFDAAKPVFFFAKATQVAPFGLGPWATYKARFEAADRLLQDQIDRVRDTAESRADILSMMLCARYEDGSRMSDAEIRDELRTLLLAGHETTAITLAWALDAVHRHPEVEARLLDELDALGPDPAPEDIAKAPYLGAVIDELLRMYPPAEIVSRKLGEPWHFAGYDLPAGITVMAAVATVHYRPDLYPEPERFRPERFLERKPGPFEYLPFGGGQRRCIGAAFAHYEARLALATMLREWTFELREPGPVAITRRNVTLGPKTGVRMGMVGPRSAR